MEWQIKFQILIKKKYLNSIFSGEHHLGYSTLELNRVSYYHLLHPDSVREVAAKHRLSKYLNMNEFYRTLKIPSKNIEMT